MPEVSAEPSRRERLRRATQTELIDAARALLVEGGLDSVTVREVARALGMTAPALYRYFPSRESLLEALIDRLYDELAGHLVAARESARSGNLTDRFLVTARAFRQWAWDHLREFGLLFGAPIPGVGRHEDDLGQSRGKQFAAVWLELFIEIGEGDLLPQPWDRPIPAPLRRQLAAFISGIGQTGVVSVETAMLYLYCWQSLYGFICTEVFGHLDWAVSDATPLWEDRLAEFRERLGLPDPTTLGRLPRGRGSAR